MLDLDPAQLDEVLEILEPIVPGYPVLAFGSRVAGGARRFSDLDLVIMSDEPLAPATMRALREAFSESNLPIKADVLDWSALSDSFRDVIRQSPTHLVRDGDRAPLSS